MKLIESCEREKQLPRGEILSRGWKKFEQIKPKTPGHATHLVRLICSQIAAEYFRDQERRSKRLITLAAQMDPLSNNHGPDEAVLEKLDQLLGSKSPLNDKDNVLLQTALDDHTKLMHPGSQPNLYALAKRFGVNPTTTGARWRRIRRKPPSLLRPRRRLYLRRCLRCRSSHASVMARSAQSRPRRSRNASFSSDVFSNLKQNSYDFHHYPSSRYPYRRALLRPGRARAIR
jgi:hypothetical protein